MEPYIKKADIVAEIDRIKKEECPIDTYEGRIKLFYFEQFLSFLDTLEVKEPNLEQEIKDYIYTLPHSRTGIPGGWKCSWPEEEVIKTVKHFWNLD